jgi:hypothetical protein
VRALMAWAFRRLWHRSTIAPAAVQTKVLRFIASPGYRIQRHGWQQSAFGFWHPKHLRPGRVERVMCECCIVEPITSDRWAILLAYLTYNSAPQVKMFVLVIIEVCPSPPFTIIMSGAEVQFEFYTVFRKRLGKIADQIPGTGTARKNLINYFVGT